MWAPDFKDILSALSTERADYLLVGAYALALHGLPRATGDLDIWVRATPENADRVLAALRRFGAPMEHFDRDNLSRPGWVFQMGVVPLRIDIITEVSGVTFDEAWAGRVTVESEGVSVPVADRSTLIRNKKASGRPKDLLDVAELEKLTRHPRKA